MNKKQQQYGLFTAISMIVGIAIGAGIFFKTDEILKYTGGNVALGVFVFCIGAFSIIFGSLTVAELAIMSKNSGGAIGYYEEHISPKIAAGFGWFQLLIYFPALGSVVSYVAGNYICSFLGLNNSLEAKVIISLILICLFFVLNILSARFGSYFQNATTIIKLIPLIILTVAGFIMSGPSPEIPANIDIVPFKDVGFGWIAALVPIVFTYDGWIVTTSLTNDVKNPQKAMPRALMIGPIIVLASYILYFLGINKMLGPQYIMSVGNNAVNVAGNMVLGPYGEKIILGFIVISVLGVVNGVIMGSLRIPYTLQGKGMLPLKLKKEISFKSCIIPFIALIFWSSVNYLLLKFKILSVGSDVSSIAIVFGYVFYSLLYIKVIKMRISKQIKSNVRGILYPILALIGALTIIMGGFMSDPIYALVFSILSMVISLIGFKYYSYSNSTCR